MVMKGNSIYFQAGAGIVYDSDATKEFEETVSKASAINSAIDLAENGLL
jgi:anthranilate synthase component 1